MIPNADKLRICQCRLLELQTRVEQIVTPASNSLSTPSETSCRVSRLQNCRPWFRRRWTCLRKWPTSCSLFQVRSVGEQMKPSSPCPAVPGRGPSPYGNAPMACDDSYGKACHGNLDGRST